LATVAVLANNFGTEGWRLVDVISAQHNTYRLSFEAIAEDGDSLTDEAHGPARRGASITSG
jgi:hypothetical protein